MMLRLDLTERGSGVTRALRVRPIAAPGVALIADPGPHLPFRDTSIDEIFVERAIARRSDIADTLDELWRICKPGALIHLRLPHASSTLAITRDPRVQPMFTLDTFNFYASQDEAAPGAPQRTAFAVERARLHLASQRGDDSGLALARGPFAQFIEKLANNSRGSQYRFERWFANLFGGFEEFTVVLAVIKQTERRSRANNAARGQTANEPAVADPTTLQVTSDVAHEAANAEQLADDIAPETAPSSSIVREPAER